MMLEEREAVERIAEARIAVDLHCSQQALALHRPEALRRLTVVHSARSSVQEQLPRPEHMD